MQDPRLGSAPVQFSPLPVTGALRGVDPRIVDLTSQAWGYVVPGGRIVVTTGVSSHSPINHAPGHALDYYVERPDGTRVRWNDPENLAASRIGAALGVHGIGAGAEYMGGTHFHWDISRNGPRTWSDSGQNQSPIGFGQPQYASQIAAARGVPVQNVLAELGIQGGAMQLPRPQGLSNQALRDAIAAVESRGSGDYSAVGPVTRGGDRAYGRYQVMDFNIGPWTEQALGRRLTPQQFLADPQAQDAVFDHVFGKYVEQYGNPRDAASVWFSGRPLSGNTSNDGFIDVPEYVRRFDEALAQASTRVAAAPQVGGGASNIPVPPNVPAPNLPDTNLLASVMPEMMPPGLQQNALMGGQQSNFVPLDASAFMNRRGFQIVPITGVF